MSREKPIIQDSSKAREEKSRMIETSLFTDPFTIGVLLVFLAVSIWYRFMPLMTVSTFLLVLTLIITAWNKNSLKGVKSSLGISKSRLFAGEEFQINAEVYNDKLLPLVWLEWSFPSMEEIVLADSKAEEYTIRFLWLLWFQRVKWELKGRALLRGVHNLGQVTLRSGDAFRFSEREKLLDLDKKLYVYPKLVPVNVPRFPVSMQWGVEGKKGGFIEDPMLLIGIREYQFGDDFRRFNWRASARTGKLQTNVYQPVVRDQLAVYADVQGFVIDETACQDPLDQMKYESNKKESFEEFLSIIASVAVKYGEQGISIGFATNGLNYIGKRMAPVRPSTNLIPLLDGLAQITAQLGAQKTEVLDEMLLEGKLQDPLFIFCDQVTEGHYTWLEQNKHRLSEVYFYYRSETDYSKKLAARAKPMDTLLTPKV